MLRHVIAGLWLLAIATPLAAAEIKPTQIAGRWTGESYNQKTGTPITLDIVACGTSWCGIKIEAGDKCGGTAMKVDYVEPLGDPQSDNLRFDGTLELAPGTEPYSIQVWLLSKTEKSPLMIQIAGDIGGVFRAYRRSFPLEVKLVRLQDAVCHAPQTVSSLR